LLPITAGKTDACLPDAIIRAMPEYKKFVFCTTFNHWATHDTKVLLAKKIYALMVQSYSDEHQCTAEHAHTHVKCLYMLDCWPVNLTAEFRGELARHCPGMELMFIPAGGTGLYQVRAM
jgi:hypothetical protein